MDPKKFSWFWDIIFPLVAGTTSVLNCLAALSNLFHVDLALYHVSETRPGPLWFAAVMSVILAGICVWWIVASLIKRKRQSLQAQLQRYPDPSWDD